MRLAHIIRFLLVAVSLSLLLASCTTSKKASSSKKPPKKTTAPANPVKSAERKLGFSIPSNDPNKKLYTEAAGWLGTPYKYGGMSKKGTDCSGITYQIYKSVYNKTLHRTSAEMAKYDVRNVTKNSLKPGDLVFFATSKNKNTITHVGVYLKNNKFIHASSKAGVVVNDLGEDYYKKAYRKGGRVK